MQLYTYIYIYIYLMYVLYLYIYILSAVSRSPAHGPVAFGFLCQAGDRALGLKAVERLGSRAVGV